MAYTEQQFKDAARKAYEAGDTATARKLIARARAVAGGSELAPQQERTIGQRIYDNLIGSDDGVQSTGEALGTWLNRAIESGTLGLVGDEASAAAGALLPGRTYEGELERFRQNEEGMSTLGRLSADVAGAIAPALTGAGLVGQASTLGGRVLTGAGLGAGAGAVQGFAEGEGGLDERAANAGQGALFGGAVGGVAPPLIGAAGRVGRGLYQGTVGRLGNAPNMTQASRAVQTAVQRSGRTPQEIEAAVRQAAEEGQGMFTLADAIGSSGQRMLAGAARQPGDARQEIVEFLASRQQGQGERVGQFVSEALQAPETAAARETALKEARKAAANVSYSAARESAAPVNLQDTVRTIDDLLGRDPLLGENSLKQTEMGRRLEALRKQLATDRDTLVDFDRVLDVKQDLGRTIERVKRSGGGVPPELAQTYGALDRALEAASPAYRQANDEFAQASRVIDQLGEGRAATSARARSENTVATFNSLTPDEQAAFRVGYADPTLARIESAAPGTNVARALTTPKAQAELGAMAVDPQRLQRQVGRENEMFRTYNAATGGSMTADNLADILDVNPAGANAIVNLLSGNFGAAAGQIGAALGNVLSGRTGATRDEIARLLMGTDIQAALQAAQQSAARNTAITNTLGGVAALEASR